jgi:hypothetical protein
MSVWRYGYPWPYGVSENPGLRPSGDGSERDRRYNEDGVFPGGVELRLTKFTGDGSRADRGASFFTPPTPAPTPSDTYAEGPPAGTGLSPRWGDNRRTSSTPPPPIRRGEGGPNSIMTFAPLWGGGGPKSPFMGGGSLKAVPSPRGAAERNFYGTFTKANFWSSVGSDSFRIWVRRGGATPEITGARGVAPVGWPSFRPSVTSGSISTSKLFVSPAGPHCHRLSGRGENVLSGRESGRLLDTLSTLRFAATAGH